MKPEDLTDEDIREVQTHAETWASLPFTGRGIRDHGLWNACEVVLGRNSSTDPDRARMWVAREWRKLHPINERARKGGKP